MFRMVQLFYPLKELIIHSDNAWVIGVLIGKARQEEGGRRREFSKKTIENVLQNCAPNAYIELLNYVRK